MRFEKVLGSRKLRNDLGRGIILIGTIGRVASNPGLETLEL